MSEMTTDNAIVLPEAKDGRGTWAGFRFDRSELAGAFGDIGTDLPLLTGMILATGLDPASVLIVFGLAQVASAIRYRLPMPVQPLKAVAALSIAQGLRPGLIHGAGIAIGVAMLLLVVSGLLERLGRWIPKPVIRGIQLGLGLKLILLALGNYIPAGGTRGLILAGLCGLVVIVLRRNRKCPAALVVVGLGIGYAVLIDKSPIGAGWFGVRLPQVAAPSTGDIIQGFLILALAQIPLSLGNSIYATQQVAEDLYPERQVTVRKIGTSYGILNLIIPFFGGVPVCHGSGGLVGHHAFGGRTGGSVLIYGGMLVVAGLFFAGGVGHFVHLFPLPVLGVILAVEGLALTRFSGELLPRREEFVGAAGVALLAVYLPYGFLIGMVAGTVYLHVIRRLRPVRNHDFTRSLVKPEETT